MDDCCEKCGEVVGIGDWPYCPHESTAPYHPFIPFYDYQLGAHIDGLATWNKAMKRTGFELADSKHDREVAPPKAGAKGLNTAYNKAVRDIYGGVLPVGSFLNDHDE